METYDYVPDASFVTGLAANFATVSTHGAAFLTATTPRPLVDAVWRALSSSSDIAKHVSALLDEQMHGMTSFGIAQPVGDGWRVIVSGDVEALVADRTLDAGTVSFTAPGVVTWSERVFEYADAVVFRAIGSQPEQEADRLSLANGIALASSLRCVSAGLFPRTTAVSEFVPSPRVENVVASSEPVLPPAPVVPRTDSGHSPYPTEDSQETAIIAMTVDYSVADVYPIEVPGLADFDHDGHTLTFEALQSVRVEEDPADGVPVVAAPVGLTFSTGDFVVLDRVVIVGRAPRLAHAPANPEVSLAPRLVAVASPGHEISRSHVAFTSLQGQPLALDLGSTNGTLLTRPGQEPQWLAPHHPTAIDPGCRLDLGEDCSILVEHP